MNNSLNGSTLPWFDWSQTDQDRFRTEFLQKIETLDSIKPIPTVAIRLLEACRDQNENIGELVNLIESDPAIAVRILTAANSPLFGQSRLINSIQHAVVVLGFSVISQMASTLATMTVFFETEDNQPEMIDQRERLFHHSIGCAVVARSIAIVVDTVDPGEAYLAGALHDVGKLVFFELAPVEYQRLSTLSKPNINISVEHDIFGITHPELGQRCAEKWGLSDEIGMAIGFHHHPNEAPFCLELVKVIETANYYSATWGIGDHGLESEPQVSVQDQPENVTDSAARNTVTLPAALNDDGHQCSILLDESTQQICFEKSRADYEKISTACKSN